MAGDNLKQFFFLRLSFKLRRTEARNLFELVRKMTDAAVMEHICHLAYVVITVQQ